MMRLRNNPLWSLAGSSCLVAALACGGDDNVPAADTENSAAIIVSPTNGDTLTGSVRIQLSTRNVEIRPAGTDEPGTGHHHLFIDRDITPIGEPIPTEQGIVHLGMAQNEYVLEGLAPGEHTVIDVIGDYQHVRLASVATDTVHFTIEPGT